jgi:hypothetical protein
MKKFFCSVRREKEEGLRSCVLRGNVLACLCRVEHSKVTSSFSLRLSNLVDLRSITLPDYFIKLLKPQKLRNEELYKNMFVDYD